MRSPAGGARLIGGMLAAVSAGATPGTPPRGVVRTTWLVVSGRSDALVPVNNNSRAYAAFNRVVEGAGSGLRYVEVTNAQHFDTFIPLSGFDTRFVPCLLYTSPSPRDGLLSRMPSSA